MSFHHKEFIDWSMTSDGDKHYADLAVQTADGEFVEIRFNPTQALYIASQLARFGATCLDKEFSPNVETMPRFRATERT